VLQERKKDPSEYYPPYFNIKTQFQIMAIDIFAIGIFSVADRLVVNCGREEKISGIQIWKLEK
jgi:hypothetical protein